MFIIIFMNQRNPLILSGSTVLHHLKCNFPYDPSGPSVDWSVGWMVYSSFIISLKVQKVTLPCSYPNTLHICPNSSNLLAFGEFEGVTSTCHIPYKIHPIPKPAIRMLDFRRISSGQSADWRIEPVSLLALIWSTLFNMLSYTTENNPRKY